MAVKGLDFLKSAERWQRYGETYHDEARSYYTELNRTALTIATFLLGFIGIFIQVGEVKTEPDCNKLILILGFISLTLSVVFGLLVFKMMNEFLNRSGDYYEQLSENLHLWMVRTGKNYDQEYPKEIYKGIDVTIKGSNRLSNAQLVLLGVGFICVAAYFLLRVV